MRVPSLTTRTVGIFLTASCFLLFFLAPLRTLLDDLSINILSSRPAIIRPMSILKPRQGVSVSVPQNNSPTSSSPTPTTSSTPHTTSTTTTPASSPTPEPSTSTVASPSQQSSSPTQTSTEPNNTPTSTTSPHSTITPTTSAILTTNQVGQTITSVVVISDQNSSSLSPSQSGSPASPASSSSGSSSSTIIGLSVAGGVALLGIIGFFVWKFTHKRRNDFDNNEEIKWPELNAHDQNAPLPTHRTGGAGIDTNDVRRSSLGYAPSTAANSTAELYPDPYAVPPLPHLDPNQAYHDDPNARFYDPYNGPVPATFEGVPGESIPMTQFAGRRSPGPGAIFAPPDITGGRASPAPQGPYDFAGRASPTPQYPGGGRASPGPAVAYAGGRASPAPAPHAYGNYGPR